MTDELVWPVAIAIACLVVATAALLTSRSTSHKKSGDEVEPPGRFAGSRGLEEADERGDELTSWLESAQKVFEDWMEAFEEHIAELDKTDNRPSQAARLLQELEGAPSPVVDSIASCPDSALRADLESARSSAMTALRLMSQRRATEAAAALARYRDLRDRVLHRLEDFRTQGDANGTG